MAEDVSACVEAAHDRSRACWEVDVEVTGCELRIVVLERYQVSVSLLRGLLDVSKAGFCMERMCMCVYTRHRCAGARSYVGALHAREKLRLSLI